MLASAFSIAGKSLVKKSELDYSKTKLEQTFVVPEKEIFGMEEASRGIHNLDDNTSWVVFGVISLGAAVLYRASSSCKGKKGKEKDETQCLIDSRLAGNTFITGVGLSED